MSYQSARGRAQLLDVLVAAQLALTALACLGALLMVVVGPSELARWLARGACWAYPFSKLLLVLSIVVWAAFCHRVACNGAALGLPRRLTPAVAVVLALFAPPAAGAFLWLDSDPTPPGRGQLMRVIGGWVLGLGVLVTAADHAGGDSVRGAALVQALAAGGWLLAGGAMLGAVRAITRRQHALWQDAELQRAAPKPAADALR